MEVENAEGSPPPESEGEGEDLRPGQGEDSSEEGSDDPEAERAIREGFIVDDDDEEGTRQKLKKRRRKHKKEKQSRRSAAADGGSDDGGAGAGGPDADDLDEDDLDLIGATSSKPGAGARKLRRLREGSVGSDDLDTNMEHMFDDEDQQRGARRAQLGEDEEDEEDDIDDFIDDDDGAQAGVAAEDGFDDEDDRRTSKAKRMQDKQAKGKAKRKFRGLKGIDRDAWEEISELFGTGEEYAWAMELDPAEDHMNREASLKDIYEPAEIAARHLTQTDAEIRQVDLPERFQVLQRAYLPSITYDEDHPLLLPEDLDAAVTYIAPRISAEHTKTYFGPQPDGSVHPLQTKFVESVGAIINEMHITGSREVPYLSAHRRDLTWSFEPTQELLNRAALWRILHLTFEFRGLLERQKGLMKRFDRLNVDDEYWSAVLWERCSASLEGTADLAEWLALIHGARARDVQAAELESNGGADGLKSRRPMSKQTKYARAHADGAVRAFASKFGVSPSALVKAFIEIEPAPVVEDAVNAPDAEAYEMTQSSTTAFKDERTLAGAARHLLVSQLSADPLMRQHLRHMYEGMASVSVKPTERGQTVIDEGHPYATFKYLNNKPVSAFDGSAQYLHIATAESEGLLEVEVTIATDARQQLFAALSALCTSQNGGAVAAAWNEEREAVLAEALETLEGHAVAHMKHRLTTDAQETVLRSVSDSFAHRIECIPYSPDPDPNNPHRGDTPSVLALSAGAGEPRKDDIRAVFLDRQGRMRESTTFETLATVGERRPQEEQERAGNARDSFKSLVRTRQPTVIVVGGWTVRTRGLLADVRRIVEEELLETPVIMVEDTTARLYRHSAEAHAEFSAMHEVARYCVGLARYVQCPAASYAALSQAQLESVRFDANQKYVPAEKLRFELEQVLVSVVNYTGMDLNRAVRNPYYQKQLPYLAGLGPRKAHMLVDKLTSIGGTLLVRADLFSKSMLKQNVFWNCTAFIRIDQAFVKGAALELGADDEHPDILDATRIHNEDYEIARKMASDAEELDDEDISALEHPSDAVRQLLADDVKKLDDLRLDDFAEELSKIMGVPKRLTLYHIREELQRPFFDKRPPMPVLTPLQAFQQISGETSESLGTGMIVPAVVMRVDPDDRSLQVRLDSGVDGQIASGYVVDGGGGDVQEVADVNLKVGDTVRAAVLRGVDQPQPEIMDARHKFELDCRPSSIENLVEEERSGTRRRQPLDPYYDAELARQDISAAENKKNKKTGRQRRLIQHACFHNMNSGQAELHLTGSMRGDCVIRPSSMGVDHLTCTWKVAEGIYQHFDILELEKPEGNNSALGRKLQVNTTAGGPGRGRVVYSDLDELIHSHVRAMAAKVEEMINHEKFKGTEEDTLTFCRNYQMANPGKPIYAFAIDQDKRRAGHFRLMFIVSRGQEPQTWPVKVVPRGFILGDAEIGSVNDLCNAFKLQYGLRHQSARQGGQSTYAPGRTPKYGGGSVYGRTPMGGSRTPMGGRSAYQGSTAYGYR